MTDQSAEQAAARPVHLWDRRQGGIGACGSRERPNTQHPEEVTCPACRALVDAKDTAARFDHDCDACTFLGRHGGADLYFCTQGGTVATVIARRSSEGSDYLSGLGSRHPALVEAAARAEALGLLVAPTPEPSVRDDLVERFAAAETPEALYALVDEAIRHGRDQASREFGWDALTFLGEHCNPKALLEARDASVRAQALADVEAAERTPRPLSDYWRDRAWDAVAEVRDDHPRVADDAPTGEILDALIDLGLLSDPRPAADTATDTAKPRLGDLVRVTRTRTSVDVAEGTLTLAGRGSSNDPSRANDYAIVDAVDLTGRITRGMPTNGIGFMRLHLPGQGYDDVDTVEVIERRVFIDDTTTEESNDA